MRRPAKKPHKRVVRQPKKKAQAKRHVPKVIAQPIVKQPVSQVLGVARTASPADPESYSLFVLAALALAIACFGAGAIPAASIGSASVAHQLTQRRGGVIALGVVFLAAAFAILAAGGK